jgi:U6 snRNA-associated Sm-like protein LSm8
MKVDMKSPVEAMLGRRVKVLMADSRVLVGVLRGLDQATNLVLAEAREIQEGQDFELGTFLVRGDCLYLVGECD